MKISFKVAKCGCLRICLKYADRENLFLQNVSNLVLHDIFLTWSIQITQLIKFLRFCQCCPPLQSLVLFASIRQNHTTCYSRRFNWRSAYSVLNFSFGEVHIQNCVWYSMAIFVCDIDEFSIISVIWWHTERVYF